MILLDIGVFPGFGYDDYVALTFLVNISLYTCKYISYEWNC